jgi:hypothetical protein
MPKASTYNTVGQREDLSDVLTILEPESTPFVSQWQTKQPHPELSSKFRLMTLAPRFFDGVGEGEDVTSFSNKAENRARIGNYIQKFRRTYAVSDIAELVDTAGVANEFAASEAKAVREIKRDNRSRRLFRTRSSSRFRCRRSIQNSRNVQVARSWWSTIRCSNVRSECCK